MSTKNAVAKAWSLIPNFDFQRDSRYSAGDRPGGNPIIIAMNRTGGATTGGENNKGSFLSLYVLNAGRFSEYGASNHVYIGGVEVDNYRCLEPCVGAGISGMSGSGLGHGVYETWSIMRLTVQVGALGTPTPGTPLNVTMTVGGRSLGNLTSGGQFLDRNSSAALTWTPHPVTFIFVDPAGNNSNDGSFGHPILDVQGTTGFTGALKCASTLGATDGIKPATDVILMDTTGIGYTRNGLGGSWMQLFRISGTAITGAAGLGPITVSGYPGAVGANRAHRIRYTADQITGAGGYYGPDQARSSGQATETCPYDGLHGYGRFIHVSDIDEIICNPLGPRDGCPINLNSSSDDTRWFNIGGQWKSTVSGTQAAKAAFIAGNGYRVRAGMLWGHDIEAGDGANQNHAVYIDGSAVCANDVRLTHSCFRDITCGNGLQTFNIQAADTIQNIVFDTIWIENVNKHGLNPSDSTRSRRDVNIVLVACGEAFINMSGASYLVAGAYQASNITGYGWARVVNSRPALWNQGGTGSGSSDVRDSIFCQSLGATGTYSFTSFDGAGTNLTSKNRWDDPNGVLTAVPSSDITGSFGDPGFNGASIRDFSLLATSPCVDAASSPLTTRNFDILCNTITGTPDIGAFEYGAHL